MNRLPGELVLNVLRFCDKETQIHLNIVLGLYTECCDHEDKFYHDCCYECKTVVCDGCYDNLSLYLDPCKGCENRVCSDCYDDLDQLYCSECRKLGKNIGVDDSDDSDDSDGESTMNYVKWTP